MAAAAVALEGGDGLVLESGLFSALPEAASKGGGLNTPGERTLARSWLLSLRLHIISSHGRLGSGVTRHQPGSESFRIKPACWSRHIRCASPAPVGTRGYSEPPLVLVLVLGCEARPAPRVGRGSRVPVGGSGVWGSPVLTQSPGRLTSARVLFPETPSACGVLPERTSLPLCAAARQYAAQGRA